jgi:hypothetical protein
MPTTDHFRWALPTTPLTFGLCVFHGHVTNNLSENADKAVIISDQYPPVCMVAATACNVRVAGTRRRTYELTFKA